MDAAKANKAEPIVIMHRDSDDLKDPVPHIIFNVKDMVATVAAIKAAGGSMASEPSKFEIPVSLSALRLIRLAIASSSSSGPDVHLQRSASLFSRYLMWQWAQADSITDDTSIILS